MHLSVLIPTRNRAALACGLLDSLAQLPAVPWKWEVIVLDNGSTDDTAERVKQKQAELPIDIRYVLEPRPGLHEGRNRGALEARGKYLAYLDDDMVLAPTWLQGVDLLEEGKADAVVGRIVPKWEAPPPQWLTRMFEGGVFGPLALLDLGEFPIETGHFYGCNLFLPRQTVLDFGGFHPDGMPKELLQYRGDGETGLWLKMKAAGKKLWYAPLAIAYHIVPTERMTLEYMKQRAYNQGISESFSELRMRHGLYGERPTVLSIVWRIIRNRVRCIHMVMYARYCRGQFRARSDMDRDVARIKHEMAKASTQGWLFHRSALRKSAALRRHVLRPSFMK